MKGESLKEIIQSADDIYLPNRYQESFEKALAAVADIEAPKLDGRKIKVESGGRVFRWMRGRNIPQTVASVSAVKPYKTVVGLTGSEWCQEYLCGNLGKAADINYYRASTKSIGRLSIIAPPSLDTGLMKARLLARDEAIPVVTVYPNIVNKLIPDFGQWLFNIRTTPEFTVSGGVEAIADALGMLAVDLVCDGDTVRENDFTVLQELQEVYPAVVTASADTI